MSTDDRPSLDRVFRHNVAVSSSCQPHSSNALCHRDESEEGKNYNSWEEDPEYTIVQ